MMKTILRIVLDVSIFIAVINGWWFIAVPLVLVGAWFFRFFIEIIIAGVAYDALFGMGSGLGWKGYVGTIGAVVFLIVVRILKRLMR